MDDVVLHPITRRALEGAVASSHHVLAFIGPYGAGKGFMATVVAQKLLGKEYLPQNVQHIQPKQGTIGIGEVRAVQKSLTLKTTGHQATRRLIIIEDAHTLTGEAQNALLKSLEEPPEDTRIILTLTHASSVLPTVYSRVRPVEVLPLLAEDLSKLAKKKVPGATDEEIKRAVTLSGGYAGLCIALLEDPEHTLTVAIAKAKQFIQANTYERLNSIATISSDKTELSYFLFALKRILSAALRTNQNKKLVAAKIKQIHQYEKMLEHSPNTKLLLTDLALSI